MAQPPIHRSLVLPTPWQGVFGTHIDSGLHYGRHAHGTYGFGLLEQGAQQSASGRGVVEACAGDLITTNPGEVHDGRPLGGPSRRWRMVYLEADAMASITGAGADVALAMPVFRDERLQAALRELFARLDAWQAGPRDDAAATLACEEALVRATGLLLDGHSTLAPGEEAAADVRQARQRLADELLQPPTLSELAAMAGLSKYQLLRRFEKAYGMPPHGWLLQQRAERARALIRQGLTLADAAAASGFADQPHMTRVFARHFGFTPGAWRRAVAQ
jgi:AraC-like DNA-binding protein